ncbi:MAG: serine hydrolase [Gluconacetobacter diazotrophicus]|nr:serine hydrolase [Gluconacetobacter diazotrophicus]
MAVALYDYALDFRFSFQASRVFHAASTIKLAILFALFRAAETGRLRLTDRLHVRNRFRSQGDGSAFFLQPDRDGDPDLYKLVGRTATLQELAETMIVRSSNLATNLLIDHLEVPFVTESLAAAGLEALRCVRGVEDEAAFARGLNNLVTADSLLEFFRRVHDARALTAESREKMFNILFQQKFNAMLPAGIPEAAKARVAHKTGEISTVTHDAGMVFLPGRAPYALVVLTEYPAAGTSSARNKTVAAVSAAVYDLLQAAAPA